MSCDYCEKEANYRFMDGERICCTCLSKYPTDRVECIKMIVELEKQVRKLTFIIDEGLGPEDLKRDI